MNELKNGNEFKQGFGCGTAVGYLAILTGVPGLNILVAQRINAEAEAKSHLLSKHPRFAFYRQELGALKGAEILRSVLLMAAVYGKIADKPWGDKMLPIAVLIYLAMGAITTGFLISRS